MDIGMAVRDARRGCGLSQARVAELVGVSRYAIIAVERGAGSVLTLERVAALVNFRFTALAAGDTIAEQLRTARKRRNLTQAEVAARAGISVPTVRSLERGRGSMRALSALLNIVGPKSRSNAIFRAHWQIKADVRFTPPEFLDEITAHFGPLALDVAGDPRSYVEAGRIITEDEDGLSTRWAGGLAWCNPPYSSLSRWITRCANAWDSREVEAIVGLFPARTETVAFRERVLGVADVLLLPRRLRFHDAERRRLAPSPFALMLCVWGVPRQQVEHYAATTGSHVMWRNTARE